MEPNKLSRKFSAVAGEIVTGLLGAVIGVAGAMYYYEGKIENQQKKEVAEKQELHNSRVIFVEDFITYSKENRPVTSKINAVYKATLPLDSESKQYLELVVRNAFANNLAHLYMKDVGFDKMLQDSQRQIGSYPYTSATFEFNGDKVANLSMGVQKDIAETLKKYPALLQSTRGGFTEAEIQSVQINMRVDFTAEEIKDYMKALKNQESVPVVSVPSKKM